MKVARGMAIILGLLVLGEAVSRLARIPVPGSVIGMIFMTAALSLKIIRLEWVKDAGDFLTGNLSLFFVPVGTGIMAYFALFLTDGPLIIGVTVFSTLCVISLTGLFHMRVSRLLRKKKEGGRG